MMLIRAYRVRGHLEAGLDPLGLKPRAKHPELDPEPTASPRPTWTGRSSSTTCSGYESATLREIVHVLRETYCGKIGVEYMHIQDPDQQQLDPEADRGQPQPDASSPTAASARSWSA